MSTQENTRKELYAANYNRARVYAHLFDELRGELGEERAAEIMGRAIHRRGREIGEQYARFAPDDFEGLKDAFLANIPDQGRMFQPRVVSCDENGLVLEFSRCPLKEAWQEMGCDKEECAKLCDVANKVDFGTFEGAGFDFEVEALPQGSEEKCVLRILPRK
jgi:hypothetical protein